MQFSRREITRHKCVDCSINVIKAGDYCMINPKIWEGKFGLGWNDNLCIACIEARLGRKLRPWLDVTPALCIKDFPTSNTLLERFGFGEKVRKRAAKRSRQKPRKCPPTANRSGRH
jgi:hypothetical protein